VNATPLLWIASLGVAGLVLLVDVAVVGRRPHVPSTRESLRYLGLYVSLAVVFGLMVWLRSGARYAGEFYAGWLTEYSLSVDNLVVFLIIMARFAVPRAYQQAALLVGILLALVLRGLFIAAGAAVIASFSWVFYLFGAFLVFTAVQMARGADADSQEYRPPFALRIVQRRVRSTDEFHGVRLSVRIGGVRMVTPMLVVLVAIGFTDLVFAFDSIPAVFGLTSEPYLVLMANIFALMGLRQLYFLLGELLTRVVYLNAGLAVLLGFIGLKLVLQSLHDNRVPFINGGAPVHWAPILPVSTSLVVIIGVLVATAAASTSRTRRVTRARAAGSPEPGGNDTS